MELVSVKTKEGRKAYADPECRQEIPSDKFVTIPMTAHVRRLIDVHKDVEVEPQRAAPRKAEAVAENKAYVVKK